MDANEAQALLENYKSELDAARDVIADLAAQMQKDSAEYREQVEKALIQVSDLSKNLPGKVRTWVEDANQRQMATLSERLTRAVTQDAEDSANRAKTIIREIQRAAARTLQSIVTSRWKMLLVLWGSPVCVLALSAYLIPALNNIKLDELRKVSARVELARHQYQSLQGMAGGMFYDTNNPKKPVLFIPSAITPQQCALQNGVSGFCFYP